MIESLGFFAGKVLCCRLPKMPWNRTERKRERPQRAQRKAATVVAVVDQNQ